MIKNEKLQLILAEDSYSDFYLFEIDLRESLSETFQAELSILTARSRSLKEVSDGLLGIRASVCLSQRLQDGKVVRMRNLHGIITAVGYQGVLSATGKQDCYRYSLTLEPEFALLRQNRHSRPYSRQSPIDIAEELCRQNGVVPPLISPQYIDRSRISQYGNFSQSNESDFHFLMHLLGMYGISYTFVHPLSSSGALGRSELYLSDGNQFPEGAEIGYSDHRKTPLISLFDFAAPDESRNLWKMDRIEIKRRTGIDGGVLNGLYPSVTKSGHWERLTGENSGRIHEFNEMFHGYDLRTPDDVLDKDIGEILEAFRVGGQLRQFRGKIECDNLLLTPGRIVHLAHFYGRNSDEILMLRIIEIELKYQNFWPIDLAAPPDFEPDSGEVKIKATAMNAGPNAERRFCVPQERGEEDRQYVG